MSGTDFNDLPTLPLPFRDTDQLYVARDEQSYRASPDKSLLGNGNGAGLCSFALFQIRKPGGESGGIFSPANTWIQRAFNYADPLNDFGSVLTSIPGVGSIQLPPGRYYVTGWMTGMENGGMRCRLLPQTGTVAPVYGASTYSRHYSWHMPIEGLINAIEPIELMAQIYCDRHRSKSWGFGYRTNLDPEIYGSLLFLKRE